jgi:RNA polymerase sigma factor (TIGR02999 family)
MSDVTQILSAIDRGDAAASEQLLPVVYEELRRLAAQKLAREKSGQTLQATALVHEAYLRLVSPAKSPASDTERAGGAHWKSRGHFFGAAAEAMRRILVENARRKQQHRRGGGRRRVTLDEADLQIEVPSEELLALDEALERLEARDPLAARLVKLRYFAGLTMAQAAEALDISLRTAERNWSYARTWLHREISKGDSRS